jgi:hypothetical protein
MYKRTLLLTAFLIIANTVLSVSAALPIFRKNEFTKDNIERFFIVEFSIIASTILVFFGTVWFYNKYINVARFTEPLLCGTLLISIVTIIANLTAATDDYFVALYNPVLPWLEFVKILLVHFVLPSMVVGMLYELFPLAFTGGFVLTIIYWIYVLIGRIVGY